VLVLLSLPHRNTHSAPTVKQNLVTEIWDTTYTSNKTTHLSQNILKTVQSCSTCDWLGLDW
jgi:hypothetical protein